VPRLMMDALLTQTNKFVQIIACNANLVID
jgi:hypothetical protein